MAKFLDYDPLRGVAQYEDEYEGRLQVHYRQDVEPVLELAKYERNHGLADRAGKKEDLYLYARIPAVTILELKYKYGVDDFPARPFAPRNGNHQPGLSGALFRKPLHPYTMALMPAIPIPNPRLKTQRTILKGDVPSPLSPPKGCRFHPRCPVAMEICSQEEPQFKELLPDHWVACWVAEKNV